MIMKRLLKLETIERNNSIFPNFNLCSETRNANISIIPNVNIWLETRNTNIFFFKSIWFYILLLRYICNVKLWFKTTISRWSLRFLILTTSSSFLTIIHNNVDTFFNIIIWARFASFQVVFLSLLKCPYHIFLCWRFVNIKIRAL